MERLPRKEEAVCKACSPAGANELEIASFVRSVELVAHNPVAAVGKMHTNLVRATGEWNSAHKTEATRLGSMMGEPPLHFEIGPRGRAVWMDALL